MSRFFFKKALNSFPHKRLKKKKKKELRAHGICKILSRWIKNQLANPQQRVAIKDETLNWYV